MIKRLVHLIIPLLILSACSAPPTVAPPTATSIPVVTTFPLPTATPPATATTSPTPPPTATTTATPLPTATLGPPIYNDPAQPLEARVNDLFARMTLAEKIGQMTQVEKGSIVPGDITTYSIGALLSGGGSPDSNTAQAWAAMVDDFQQRALQTRLHIPLLYGVDAVHGHNNLRGATLFPHNVGLGATRDPDLVQRIGRATAEEMVPTGIR